MVLQNNSNKVVDSFIVQGEFYIDMDGVLVDFSLLKLSGVKALARYKEYTIISRFGEEKEKISGLI